MKTSPISSEKWRQAGPQIASHPASLRSKPPHRPASPLLARRRRQADDPPTNRQGSRKIKKKTFVISMAVNLH
jgi:hypothetical protein